MPYRTSKKDPPISVRVGHPLPLLTLQPFDGRCRGSGSGVVLLLVAHTPFSLTCKRNQPETRVQEGREQTFHCFAQAWNCLVQLWAIWEVYVWRCSAAKLLKSGRFVWAEEWAGGCGHGSGRKVAGRRASSG